MYRVNKGPYFTEVLFKRQLAGDYLVVQRLFDPEGGMRAKI